jgi:hypothetical protein
MRCCLLDDNARWIHQVNVCFVCHSHASAESKCHPRPVGYCSESCKGSTRMMNEIVKDIDHDDDDDDGDDE